MTNPFEDQKQFMLAAGQTVGVFNPDQLDLYQSLVIEEVNELFDAKTLADVLKETADVMVVLIGALHSLGVDPQQVWSLVHESNMSKIHPDGKLHKRADGKVLKPDTYKPADMAEVVLIARPQDIEDAKRDYH